MDVLGYTIPALLGLVSVAMTAVVGKVIGTDKTITAHVAADDVNFRHIEESFKELKEGQKATNEKLDKLIEHLMMAPEPPPRPGRRRVKG